MPGGIERDRDPTGRPRNARPRDDLGRPLARGSAGTPPADEPPLPAATALSRADILLDAGRPFEAHEVLEAVWKTAPADEQMLWKGLAQLAVGLTHRARGNAAGAAALLRRGAETLVPFAGRLPHGVPVDRLREWAVLAADGEDGPRPPFGDQAADARD